MKGRLGRVSYVWRRFDGMARVRAAYWFLIRGYEYEVCQHCGRPVGLVWWCHDDKLWEEVTGRAKTPGSDEAAGGVWCISCFDAAARERADWIEWAPMNLRYLGARD